MANETLSIDRWIYTTITGDATMLAGVSTRVYSERAPQNPTSPYVVYTYFPMPDTNTLDGRRVLVKAQYLIRVVKQTADFADIEALADRLDYLFNAARNGSNGTVSVYASYREAPYRLAEDDYGVEYRQLGGIYNIIARDTA